MVTTPSVFVKLTLLPHLRFKTLSSIEESSIWISLHVFVFGGSLTELAVTLVIWPALSLPKERPVRTDVPPQVAITSESALTS